MIIRWQTTIICLTHNLCMNFLIVSIVTDYWTPYKMYIKNTNLMPLLYVSKYCIHHSTLISIQKTNRLLWKTGFRFKDSHRRKKWNRNCSPFYLSGIPELIPFFGVFFVCCSIFSFLCSVSRPSFVYYFFYFAILIIVLIFMIMWLFQFTVSGYPFWYLQTFLTDVFYKVYCGFY